VSAGRLGTLRAAVVEGLAAHGIAAGPEDTPAALREHQRSGQIPLAEYAGHAEALKRRYPLLGMPLSLWTE